MKRICLHILIVGMLAPVTVSAQDAETTVKVSAVWLVENELYCSVVAENLLEDSARETIRGGGTAAVDYTFELYRHRRGWFDSLIESRDLQFRISYDAFELQYRLISPDLRLKTDDFSRVVTQCTSLSEVSFGTMDELRLDQQANYYIVVRVRYQPMSVETIDDLRDWVSGSGREEEQQNSKNRGEGFGSRIARVVMSAAGFGEEELQGESQRFRPSELEIRIPPESE
ncbi:DUF4390 domain-containing protein [Gemmatimonadota bacterium]